MLKKSLILSFFTLSLTACISDQERYAKYKISNDDIKQVIAQYKSTFYCLYPEAINKSPLDTYNLVYRKISDAENSALLSIVYQEFTRIIGQRDTDLMFQDNNSKIYMENKWRKLYSSVKPTRQSYFKCGQKDKQNYLTNFVKPIEQHLAQERQEREAYLKTPQGRMEAQQNAMMQQQAAMQAAAMAQRQRMHNDTILQQLQMQQQQMWQNNQQMWQQQNQYLMQQMQKAGQNIGRGWAW